MKKWMMAVVWGLLALQPAAADEGMWMIQQLDGDLLARMRAKGLRLGLREIYDESRPSLSDAVVAIDGGVGTGSMISDEGLMITNHHVAYSDICALSTPEANYLETGFWAQSRAEELPVEGKTVSFLRKVIDVTDEAQALIAEMKAAGRWTVMSTRRLFADLERRHGEGTPYEASCVSLWSGRRYLIYFYEVYRDVRLVGAPPVSIGAFGGTTDNWGWPQHKGDFALYRVYADREGRPAAYSPDNVPLHPRRVLTVAASGVHDGDFTMVIGFPGRTHRYDSSFAVEEKRTVKNPVVVACRHERMEVIDRRMRASDEVRMKYSDAYFGLSNYADYALWENKCLRRFDVAAIRAEEERRLQAWIEADPARTARYGELLGGLKRGFDARREAMRTRTWFQESWLGPSEALLTANRVASYVAKLLRERRDTLDIAARDAQNVVSGSWRLNKNYDAATDRELLVRMADRFTKHVDRALWGEELERMYDRYAGDARRMAGEAFGASCCSDARRYESFFAQNRPVAELLADPLVALARSVSIPRFAAIVERAEKEAGVDVGELTREYVQALYEFREAQGTAQYPNANSTMRLSYGTVGPVDPADGVHYDSRSTVRGYDEKYDPADYEFRVDERMRALVAAKQWGRWGERGTLYVDFLTDNDITGGNSGSPVLDGRGRLVGLAFDGNRESMANDLYFESDCSKTVCVDIRFVMWTIEHYAGAGRLLDELRFVR